MKDDLTKIPDRYFSGKLDENAHLCSKNIVIKYKITNFYLIIKVNVSEIVLRIVKLMVFLAFK